MAVDRIYLDLGFYDSRKTKRLIRHFGSDGIIHIQKLWIHAARHRPKGDLSGYDFNDIADAADFDGNAEHFVSTLCDLRFLDRCGDGFILHKWPERQPFVFFSPERSRQARNAAKNRWKITTSKQEVNADSNADSNTDSNAKEFKELKESKELKETKKTKPKLRKKNAKVSSVSTNVSHNGRCPVEKIVALYHVTLPELPRTTNRAKAVRSYVRQRWRESPERQSLENWEAFFLYIRESEFLMGQKTDFIASLEWICRPRNFAKILSGFYNHKPAYAAKRRLRDWLEHDDE